MGEDVAIMLQSTTQVIRQSETMLETLASTHVNLAALLVDLQARD